MDKPVMVSYIGGPQHGQSKYIRDPADFLNRLDGYYELKTSDTGLRYFWVPKWMPPYEVK
jgi:hypothetical protein